MSTIQQHVQGTIERMTTALDTRDIEGVMKTYEHDAVILFEPAMPVSDSATKRQLFTGLAAAKPRFDYGEHEVIVAGDIALHVMPWTMTGTAPDGGAITQGGLSVAVLRRQRDGQWLMVIDNPHGQRLLRHSQ
ncbi:MAG: nuclear transport factor 2 family protein [Vicinamibacterales bacterium]